MNKRLDNLLRVNATTAGKNNNSVNLAERFLRYGSGQMSPSWSETSISDKDMYSGFGYATIVRRANRTAVVAKRYLYTGALPEILAAANNDKTAVSHPYLALIRESTNFSERDFWHNISTYLDLEGVFYLYAPRRVYSDGHVGKIQSFSLLNPYNVRKVVSQDTGELGGYIETRDGRTRAIQKEMIIEISHLNPFDSNGHFGLADAARDAQFTMKQASDYARQAIQGNLNTPGIVSTSLELEEEDFENFVARLQNHQKGEPIFGNGSGTVGWTDMQIDLDKAALSDINSIHLNNLFAIGGVSKTMMGMEESGTGREVSRTQKDDFTENAVMPQIEAIIDALNLDYRSMYPKEWEKTHYTIKLDNPLETDRDAELAAVEVRRAEYEVMKSLVDSGYSPDVASKFARGEIDITDLGEPEDTDADDGNDGDVEGGPDRGDNSSMSDIDTYKIPIRQFFSDDVILRSNEDAPKISVYDAVIDKVKQNGFVTIAGISVVPNSETEKAEIFGKFKEGKIMLATTDSDNALEVFNELQRRYTGQKVAIKK